jgi:hypothetical protein
MRFVLSFVLSAAVLRADESLVHARQAQALLGAAHWSRVIQIENVRPTPRYGKSVGALVFELENMLWMYVDSEGTQSLSQYPGRLAQDEADFGPLLRAIEPGFTRWTNPPPPAESAPAAKSLPNGCFIECVVLLRRRLASGEEAREPRLLAYYTRVKDGVHGHTVLEFRTREGLRVIDPEWPQRIIRVGTTPIRDAQDVATFLRDDVVSARWLPLDDAARSESSVYASGRSMRQSAIGPN